MERDYDRIEQAITYLEANFRNQPDLARVASQVGLSEYHFQRLFTRWAGISPKRFLQFLTADYAASLLRTSDSVLSATYAAGLSGPARLHDLILNVNAVTPGELKSGGAGVLIRYGRHDSPFGECILAVTDRGICGLTFVHDGGADAQVDELEQRWPAAELVEDPRATGKIAESIFAGRNGVKPGPLALLLKGTNFQIKVWEALLRIPPGAAVSYEGIARYLGSPSASRAVGAAVGANPIAYLIPCHRVLRKSGALGEYHWGTARKKAILGWEAARGEAVASQTG